MERRTFIANALGLAFLPGTAVPGFGFPILSRDSQRIGVALPDRKIVERGDIKRGKAPRPDETWLPLYQANGRFGSSYGPWGLHQNPGSKPAATIPGAMHFLHIQHYLRGSFNADYLLPIGKIFWEVEPSGVQQYFQHQSFYDGTITTSFGTDEYEVSIVSWFDPERRDLAGFRIEAKGKCPAIIFSPSKKFSLNYGQEVAPAIHTHRNKRLWVAEISHKNARSAVNIVTAGRVHEVDEGLKIDLQPGMNNILISINSTSDISAGESLENTRSRWHETWNNSGWLALPDEDAQKVWVRSLAYTFYSHNDDGIGCSPPTGLSGNGWPFPFPFDSGCRHPLLLSVGNVNAAKKWIEFWHSRLDGLKEYTRRLYHSDGIFFPHVFPFGQAHDFHEPGVPNEYYYPVYNSALMVRMADQTALMVNDDEWKKMYVDPLVGEAAKFYLHQLKKGDDGLWHLHMIPSISLDESGDVNKRDYYSGLVSAGYTLKKAVGYGLDADGKMQQVLNDGLAFSSLVAKNGLYLNHYGQDAADLAKQKHPDQLFPIIHTPFGHIDEPTRRAHLMRYDIAEGARQNRFIGHTLGEFILASARMHDADAWRKDWSMIVPGKYADPDLIQFYESTGNTLSFYVTTHGLFAQAILETVVSTWWNSLDLAACIPWKGSVRFGNIRTLLGVTVSGEIENGSGEIILDAWKDTTFYYRNEEITMRTGDRKLLSV